MKQINNSLRIFKLVFSCGGYTSQEWFELSMKEYREESPSTSLKDFDYVQVVPMSSYRRYYFNNDGAQGWRHKLTGWTIPDYCRQRGGTPELWNKTRSKQLWISDDSPIHDFIIGDDA